MGLGNRFKKMLGFGGNSDEKLQKINEDNIETDSNDNIEQEPADTFENTDIDKNFRYLSDLIHSGAKEIVLESDIVFADNEYSHFKDGIRLDVDDIVIDGNGYTIDGDGRVRIFDVNGKGIKLKNITFKNGRSTSKGGAIHINKNSSLDINECIFNGNSAKDGGGAIYTDGAKVNMSKSLFNKNTAENILHFSGGAIETNGGIISVFKCSFVKNRVEHNGATIYSNECELKISESIFNRNVITEIGGVISGRGGNEIKINDSSFNKNNVCRGGIIRVSFADIFTLSGCSFEENVIGQSGGILDVDDGELSVYNSTINQNTLNGCSVAYNYWGNLKILKCEITKNNTSGDLIHNNSFMEVIGANVASNTAKNIIFNTKESTSGIFNCRFTDNAAKKSVIFSDGKACTIEKGTFENNLAYDDSKNIINQGEMTLINPGMQETSETILNNKHILLKMPSSDLLSKIGGKGKVETYDVTIPDEEKFDFGYLDRIIHKSAGNEIVLENDITLERYETDFYEGGIELDMDNLTIDGKGNSITANGKSRIFIITANNITLKNITFKNGHQHKNPNNPLNNNGGAIRLNKCRKIIIENCKFIENFSEEYGGAIHTNGDLTITKSKFDKNKSIRGGCISNESSLTMIESELYENSAKILGGAIYNTGKMSVFKSSINKNTAQSGGAIYNNESLMDISLSILYENTTTYSGGGAIENNKGEMSISKTEFNRNSTPNWGGAIYNYEGIISISLSTMNENTTSGKDSQGGAIYNTRGKLTIKGCEFNGNTSKRYGGGISNSYGELTVSNSSFIKNKSNIEGGAIYSYAKKVKCTDCTFKDNSGAFNIYEILD